MAKYINISNANYMIVSGDPAGVNDNTIINKNLIVNVTPIYAVRPSNASNPQTVPPDADKNSNFWTYPYDTVTQIALMLNDGREERFELQDIPNGSFVGFTGNPNTGTQANVNSAVADIAAWL